MSLSHFQQTQIYTDLVEAIHEELRYNICNYLGSIQDEGHYVKYGYPPPRRGDTCWCHRTSSRPCQDSREVCPKEPRLSVGSGFEITQCRKCHGPDSVRDCGDKNCFQYSQVVPRWVRLVVQAQEQQQQTAEISDEVKAQVSTVVREYQVSEQKVQSYANAICILFENLRNPNRRMGMRWKPEIHGVLALQHEELTLDEFATLMLLQLRGIKAERERNAAREAAHR